MNTCFINSSMVDSEAPFLYPNMQHGVSVGDPAGARGADMTEHFMANNAMFASSSANQLAWAAPPPVRHDASMSPEEEMNNAYAVASESGSTVHSMLPPASCSAMDFFQYGASDVTIAHPSKMAKLTGEPPCRWLYDGPITTSVHEPYYLTRFADAGYPSPLAVTASELSLRLGARSSSSVAMLSLPDQSSEVQSCSGLTNVNSEGFCYQQPHASTGVFQPPYGDVGAAGDELRRMYPMMYSTPLHFSQVLSGSRYTHIAQELLNAAAGYLLKDVAESTDSVGGEASPLLSSSCSARTLSSVSSNQLMLHSDEHRQGAAESGRWMEGQKMRNDLLQLLQLMDQKCNQCFDDIQNVTNKFSSMEMHSGGGGGIPTPPFAHREVSLMHQRLKKRIESLDMAVTQRCGSGEPSDSSSLADKERSWESSFIQKHWAVQQLRRGDHQSWRPQRGLPREIRRRPESVDVRELPPSVS